MNNKTFLKKTFEIIPWGTQTNAKRPDLENKYMPYFIDRAKDCRIKDLDGKTYIDYRCALGPIILGYRCIPVDNAVRKQMRKGTIFSMASPIEYKLAQKISEIIPCAENVRFMKTGADANSALIKIARAYTKRKKIIITSYHGWHDTFCFNVGIKKGVPDEMKDLVYLCEYGNYEKLEEVVKKDSENIAAVLTVPYDWEEDTSGDYIKKVREITKQYRILLIFDEILTGFRLALGGAQEYFGEIPDLASFGKAVSNGYPLSVFCGKKEYMKTLDDIFITTTYAGETLSIAASIATIKYMKKKKVIEHIWEMGKMFMDGINEIGVSSGFPIRAVGLPPACKIRIDSENEENLMKNFFAELYKNGVFPNSMWFISYSHKEEDVRQTLKVVKKIIKSLIL